MEEEAKLHQKELETEPTQITYNDSLVNVLKLGDLVLQSPFRSPEELFKLAVKILKNKSIQDYLVKFESKKVAPYLG